MGGWEDARGRNEGGVGVVLEVLGMVLEVLSLSSKEDLFKGNMSKPVLTSFP